MQMNKETLSSGSGNPNNRKQVPVEKKMQLAQYIREENMDNRMKIRQREKILYGTDSMPPLWSKGEPPWKEEYLRQDENAPDQIPPSSGTFKLRMAAAIFLFIGFLLCDAGQYKIFGYSMSDIYGMISNDYFQIYDADTQLSDITEGITQIW